MTTQGRYPLLQGHAADGRLSSAEQQQQLWKLRKSVLWLACLLLILFLNFALIYWSDTFINLNRDGPSEISSAHVSPSTPLDHGDSTARPVDFNLALLAALSAAQDRVAPPPPPDIDVSKLIDFSVGGCNLWRGDWIPHPHPPAYTNVTCPFIQDNQNCMKLGRADLGFLHWRWKPHDCELPLFDAKSFLEIVAGKKWAFIGDSVARNHFQSVLCHLAQVELPKQLLSGGGNQHWYFPSYNFTFAVVWSPFLVKGDEHAAEGFAKGFSTYHLDVPDESWGPSLHNYDYIVLSGGHWYVRPGVYFVKDRPVGCHECPLLPVKQVGFAYAYTRALRAVFDFLISSKYKGVVFFRTFSPTHWQYAPWDQGGNCTQTSPLESTPVPSLDWLSKLMYDAQLQEFGKTVQRQAEYSFKLKILDTLHATLLRPDAHPAAFGHFHSRVKYDCMHWCLPGAVDAWTAMLLHALKDL